MLILILKSQQFLFDAPVHVGAHVRKDGTVVKPHTRIQKVALHQPAAHQLGLFGEAKPEPQKKRTKLQAFIDKQGGRDALAGKLRQLTEEQQRILFEKMAALDGGDVAAVRAMFADAKPREPAQQDLFAQVAPKPEDDYEAERKKPIKTGDAMADYWANSAGSSIQRDVKRGRVKKVDLTRKPDSDVKAPTEGKEAARPDSDVKDPAAVKQDLTAARHDRTAPFGVPAGVTKAERRAINAKVADLVANGGTDLDLMRQYSGNGGCGDSLNEFYTDPGVAAAQWDVIQRLGITSGTALEPSCATGVFLHTAPEGFRVTGVEMGPISSACAQALHGDRHEIRGSTSFERFARSDGGRQFDVVIGNPPYGPRGSLAKDDKPELKTAEAYFIDTAIDKARAGGIVSLVIPASVLNNKNGRAFRERILRKAEFLGAQRMPNTAFEASHTDVTADVIWLRKRPDDVAGALMTVDRKALKALGVWDDEFLAGTYFEGRGKDNVFGTEGTAMRAYGEVYTVNGSMDGVPAEIAGFEPHPVGTTPTVPDIVAALGDDEKAVKRALGGAMVRPYADAKAGDTKVVDGVTYVLQGDPLRWHRVDELLQHEAVADAKPIAEQIEALITGSGAVDRPALEEAIHAWVARHGIPARSKHLTDAAEHEKVLHRLIGAVDHTGRLSDLVAGRTAKQVTASLDTAAATLAAEHEDGTFTPEDLANLTGKDADEVLDNLVASSAYAYTGDGRWTTMDTYLTGDLWPKLDAAKAADHPAELAEKLAFQVKRLDETIAPKSLEDVEIALNAGFIPPEVIAAWLNSRVQAYKDENPGSQYANGLQLDAEVTFKDSIYTVKGGMWGEGDLIAKYLNRTGVRKDDMPKVDRFNAEFRAWLLTSNYRDEVEELYNRRFRGFVEPRWSDAPIDIPGLAAERVNAYHWSSLRWALARGKGIIADDVGLGKSIRGLMLARLAKMTGKASKPTFVVPKSVLANWAAEVDNWFPGSRVLIIGETYTRDKAGNLKSRPDTEVERNRKYHDLTQNDYDFVFISQPAFNELDVDPITKGEYLDQDFWVQRGDKLGNAGDKQVKRVRENYKQAVADREFNKRTDAVYFNELGIDMLVVDESHCFPSGTLVDGRPIESIRAGDLVSSFDHETGSLVMSTVANLQVKVPNSMFRIRISNGKTIHCTGAHPFLTPDGYVFAKDLVVGDILYSLKQESLNHEPEARQETRLFLPQARGGLRTLRESVRDEQGAGLEAQGAWSHGVLLQQIVRQETYVAGPGNPAGCDSRINQEGAGICGADARHEGRWLEPDGRPCGQGKGICYKEGLRVQAADQGRQRPADAGSAAEPAIGASGARTGLGGRVHPENGDGEGLWVSMALQAGHCEPVAHGDGRGGRRIAQLSYPAGPGPEEGGFFERAWVEDVAVLKQTSDGRFGGVCPDGFVYNIEVERTHTYIVGDVIVHNSYKNLHAAKARFGEQPKFLGGSGQSNRAFDMSFKAKWLRENHAGAGVYGLTATPTKNSPLEVYSMLSYVAPEAFERIGIRNSEDFLDRYCVFKNENTLGTDGAISEQLVTVGFKNLDELREIMAKYIMRRTAQDVGLKLPEASQEMHLVDMTPAQSAAYGELRALLAEAGGKKDATGDAHVFSIMDKMAKAAMDLELLDKDKYAGQRSPKYSAAAKEIASRVKDGGQVVFCESVPSHAKIADALVAAGVPRERIAIMNAAVASSSAARQNISDKFNAGLLDVVIGNKVMEEGVNLQKRTSDIHHLDTPWDPATLQQRNGRGVRQGNVNEAIRLHTYLARGSFDGYRYQSMRAKRDWAEMLWNGGDRVDNLAREGVFSREDMMVMMSADPDEARAKLAADKDAAMQRLTAERTSQAAGEFVRFQSLKRSLNGLKNKDSQAAHRLRAQIENAKTGLMANKYFKAKAALDGNDEVLVNPASGDILTRNMGLECTEADGSTSKWVVTGVDPVANTVSMRMYADTTGHRGVTVPATKLSEGVKSFNFDEHAESEEVGKKLEADANAKLDNLTEWDDVAKMPAAVLERNYDLIQRQIKEGRKSYKFSMPHGDIAMVDRETGKLKMVSDYNATSLHDTHDYLLPTEANKEKAIQAWMDARRSAKYGKDLVQRTRGAGSRSGASDWVNKRDYTASGAGYMSRHINPFKGLLGKMSGDPISYNSKSKLEREAMARLNTEQRQRIASATSTDEAMRELLPLGQLNSGAGAMPVYPEDALRAVWEKAKANGDLGKRLGHIEELPKHENYAFGGADSTRTVLEALVRMARASGKEGLATEMTEGGADQVMDPRHAYELHMPRHGSDLRSFELALAAAERGGFADQQHPVPHSYGWNPDRGKTTRQVLQEKIAQARAHEAAKKEAA